MARAVFAFRDGKLVEIYNDDAPKEPSSAYIQQDTLDRPLRNPVDGKLYDSKSAYLRSLPDGYRVIGNEKLSKLPRNTPEKITEAKIMDAQLRAESILGDPAKHRAYHNMNMALYERNQKLLKDGNTR